jgi:hypothetical protein
MKYFIKSQTGREVVKTYLDKYPELNSIELSHLIMSECYEEWMDNTTPSLRGNDTVLSHMVRSVKSVS